MFLLHDKREDRRRSQHRSDNHEDSITIASFINGIAHLIVQMLSQSPGCPQVGHHYVICGMGIVDRLQCGPGFPYGLTRLYARPYHQVINPADFILEVIFLNKLELGLYLADTA